MLQLTLYFFCLAAVPLLVAIVWWYATIPPNLPPGPVGLPFIGCGLSTWKAKGLYQRLLQWARIYGPLYKIYVADRLIVVLASWEVIQEALVKQGEAFVARPELHLNATKELGDGGGIDAKDYATWKTHRHFAMVALRELGIRSNILENRIRDEVNNLVEQVCSFQGHTFDPAPVFQRLAADVVASFVFGHALDFNDASLQQALKANHHRAKDDGSSILAPWHVSKTLATLLPRFFWERQPMFIPTAFVSFVKSQIQDLTPHFDIDNDAPTNYIEAFMKQRKRTGDNETYSDHHLLHNVIVLFSGGTETIAATLCWALHYLCHHPEIQESLYEEIDKVIGDKPLTYADRASLPFTMAALMETHRLGSVPMMGGFRSTTADCKLFGYDIPAGTFIVPLLTSSHYDPAVYPNPERFDPRRFLEISGTTDPKLTHLMPFQAGKRQCPGEPLARIELFLVFAMLVSRFKFTFAADEPIPAIDDEYVTLVSRRPRPFNISAVPRY